MTIYKFGKSDELIQKYLKRRRQPARVKKQIRRLTKAEGNKIQILQGISVPQIMELVKGLF